MPRMGRGSGRQKLDSKSQLAEDDRIDGDLAFLATEPSDDLWIRAWPRGLAEDIRVNEKFHGGSQVVSRF